MEHTPHNPKEDLQAIREIMERSSRFLSLSGISGVFAGAVGLIGALAAYMILPDLSALAAAGFEGTFNGLTLSTLILYMAVNLLLVLMVAVVGAVYFSVKKAHKANQPFWNTSTKRMIYYFLIPFITGGVFILILVFRNDLELVAPAMLIFYGLALVNAGKFTLSEVHYLGITEIVLGLMAAVFIN
ncbi:MAG: hypothetical protein ACM3O8_11255, partial [Methylococcaceae bacterium]